MILSTNTWNIQKKEYQFLNIIKFLYCSFVITTGKEKLLIRREHFTCFSGNYKKKKKKIPATEKRIMKCRKTGKLSARKEKHIHNLKEHSRLLKTQTNINPSHINAFPLPPFQALLTASCYFFLMQRTLSNRDCKSKAGRHPIDRVYLQLYIFQ